MPSVREISKGQLLELVSLTRKTAENQLALAKLTLKTAHALEQVLSERELVPHNRDKTRTLT